MRYLLHVGMAQSASTFLQDVVFPNCSELNFINRADIGHKMNFYNPLCAYEDYFWSERAAASWLKNASDPEKLNVISFERLSCTQVLSRNEVAQRLARLCPGAKCLIVVRNQFDAIVSAFAQHANIPNLFLPRFADHFAFNIQEPQSSEFRRYYYDEFVGTYEQLFGSDAVLVLPFELLTNDGPAFVERVCKFTGVEVPIGLDRIKVNQRAAASYIELRRIAQKLASPETLRRYWLGIPYPLRQNLKSLFGRGRRFEVALSNEQKTLIAMAFGEGNEELSRRRNLRLVEQYGYPCAPKEMAKCGEHLLLESAPLEPVH